MTFSQSPLRHPIMHYFSADFSFLLSQGSPKEVSRILVSFLETGYLKFLYWWNFSNHYHGWLCSIENENGSALLDP